MSFLFDQEDEVAPAPDPSRRPPPPKRRRRWIAVLGLPLVVLLVAGGAGGLWAQGQIDPAGDPGPELAFTIPNGATSTDIGALLEEAGVITSARVWRWYLRAKGGGPFQAGAYTLAQDSAMGDVVATLEAGPQAPPSLDLTVPEGLWVSEVAERMAAIGRSPQTFADLASSGAARSSFQPEDVDSLEGLLFPDTYTFEETVDEAAILDRMLRQFEAVATELGYADAPVRVGLSPYEAVVVASLVEAEARVDDDRAKIARVVYNRLEQGMLLQIDATNYFADRCRGSGCEFPRDIDSPFNTYLNTGLPPTPIAIPGRASLEAALNPEPGPWTYYVLADERGTHAFTDNLSDFNDLVAEARRNGFLQ